MLRIALAQMKNEGTIEKNLKKSISLIKEAAGNNTDLILFPEVQLTGKVAMPTMPVC